MRKIFDVTNSGRIKSRKLLSSGISNESTHKAEMPGISC